MMEHLFGFSQHKAVGQLARLAVFFIVCLCLLCVCESSPETEQQQEVHPRQKRFSFKMDLGRQPFHSRKPAYDKLYRQQLIEDKCVGQAKECHPFMDYCCGGMSCLNLIRGFCVYGREMCICQPRILYDSFYRVGRSVQDPDQPRPRSWPLSVI